MKKILLTLVALVALTGVSVASNKDDMEVAELSTSFSLLESSGTGRAVAMNLYYVGSATEAVVTITSATFLSEAPDGTLDSNFASGGAVDLGAASYDTMGELCDYIDGKADYGCTLVGARRADNTNRLRDQTGSTGTNDLKANQGFDVHFDTGNINGGGDFNSLFDLRVGRQPTAGKRLRLKNCYAHMGGSGDLRVYGKLKIRENNPVSSWTWTDATEVYREALTANIGSTITFHAEGIGGIDFARDAHVVVSAGNGTTLTVSSNYLRCIFEEK